jgi:hypothetical protein
MRGCLLIPLLATFGCSGGEEEKPPPPPPAGAIPLDRTLGTAVIEGRAILKGTPPERKRLDMRSDPFCREHSKDGILDPSLIVNGDGTLQNVFVYIQSGLGDRVFAWPTTPAVMDQVDCLFTPRVLGVQVNQAVEIRNSDPTFHNVNRRGKDARHRFNIGLAAKGMNATRYFKEEEVMVEVSCDVHPWMAAYIGVVPHPYFAVTGEKGSYRFAGLPGGTYRIEAWHERYKFERQVIEVADGVSKTADFEFQVR